MVFVHNDELEQQLVELGFEKRYEALLKRSYVPISVGQISELCKEGKLNVKQCVDCYHIDTLVGLVEFVKFITE